MSLRKQQCGFMPMKSSTDDVSMWSLLMERRRAQSCCPFVNQRKAFGRVDRFCPDHNTSVA